MYQKIDMDIRGKLHAWLLNLNMVDDSAYLFNCMMVNRFLD